MQLFCLQKALAVFPLPPPARFWSSTSICYCCCLLLAHSVSCPGYGHVRAVLHTTGKQCWVCMLQPHSKAFFTIPGRQRSIFPSLKRRLILRAQCETPGPHVSQGLVASKCPVCTNVSLAAVAAVHIQHFCRPGFMGYQVSHPEKEEQALRPLQLW